MVLFWHFLAQSSFAKGLISIRRVSPVCVFFLFFYLKPCQEEGASLGMWCCINDSAALSKGWIKNVNLFRSCLSMSFNYIYISAYLHRGDYVIKRWLYNTRFMHLFYLFCEKLHFISMSQQNFRSVIPIDLFPVNYILSETFCTV